MDTRDLKERLSDPDWVKDWFDQAGSEAVRRIEALEATCADCAQSLRLVLADPAMRAGPDGEGQDNLDMIEAVAADLVAAAKGK